MFGSNNFDYSRIPDSVYHQAVMETLGDRNLSGGNGNSDYNFRCPICGDSESNKNKKRGYVYTKNWRYECYNGCGGMQFLDYLKVWHPEHYKKVIFHAYDNSNRKIERKDTKTKAEKTYNANNLYKFKHGELVQLTDDHPLANKALEYCISRKIRPAVYKKWFVCLKDDKFLDRDVNGNLVYNDKGFPTGNEYGDRIIIPYYKYGGKWIQFDARALDPNAYLRYRNLEGAEREMYNIDFINFDEPFFLLEGAIDSTFIRNAVSFGGAKHLKSFLDKHPEILKHASNGTIIWDNDDTGRDETPKTVKLGFNWFEWTGIEPNEANRVKSDGTINVIKDINNAVLYSDCFRLDSNGYIVFDDLKKYIRKAEGSLIKLTLLNGNREKQRKEKLFKMREKAKTQQPELIKPYF